LCQNLADKFRNAIGIFINQIMREQPITIFGDGLQTRSFSYIDDVAPVIAASVLFEAASNEAFFVGVDDVTSVNDLAESLKAAMGAPNHPVKERHARGRQFRRCCRRRRSAPESLGSRSSHPTALPLSSSFSRRKTARG